MKTNTTNTIEEAKNWMRDCIWREDEQDDNWIDDLDDLAIIREIDRYYDGGWIQFVKSLADPENPKTWLQFLEGLLQ